MKRDMDLVRTILKTCADATEPVDASVFVDETHSMQLIVYHFKIMSDAGLVESDINGTWNGSTIRASVRALTWDGNDFLDAVRSDSLWSKNQAEDSRHRRQCVVRCGQGRGGQFGDHYAWLMRMPP